MKRKENESLCYAGFLEIYLIEKSPASYGSNYKFRRKKPRIYFKKLLYV